ncbi:LytTR family transcriptional regulator [Candidatus Saccharibacteria bacterium]|nr:LytTR family transcriptional regulator [Candidatus Saccharibacteria bacterium]MCL1963040.1 LytTR family transcriptional regulator [Candidatus Saccharibacteria bacterium]
MKICIDIDESLPEPEIAIRGRSEDVAKLQTAILAAVGKTQKLALLRDGREFFVPTANILFFDSVDGKTWVHTAKNIYEIRLRLYELEQILPPSFARASKSAILNTAQIWSIRRNLAGPSIVQFRESSKQISLSRSFYKPLIERLSIGKPK